MMIIKEAPSGSRCVFHGGCENAPATHVVVAEFARWGRKPVCDMHADVIRKTFPSARGEYR